MTGEKVEASYKVRLFDFARYHVARTRVIPTGEQWQARLDEILSNQLAHCCKSDVYCVPIPILMLVFMF